MSEGINSWSKGKVSVGVYKIYYQLLWASADKFTADFTASRIFQVSTTFLYLCMQCYTQRSIFVREH